MTREEFKAEILKANPKAVFIDRKNGDIECTETEMCLCHSPRIIGSTIDIVYGFASTGQAKTEKMDYEFMIAPSPKKTRLMTPQECAGKWLVTTKGRAQVTGFSDNTVDFLGCKELVSILHIDGVNIADTPTSAPYSLKVAE